MTVARKSEIVCSEQPVKFFQNVCGSAAVFSYGEKSGFARALRRPLHQPIEPDEIPRSHSAGRLWDRRLGSVNFPGTER